MRRKRAKDEEKTPRSNTVDGSCNSRVDRTFGPERRKKARRYRSRSQKITRQAVEITAYSFSALSMSFSGSPLDMARGGKGARGDGVEAESDLFSRFPATSRYKKLSNPHFRIFFASRNNNSTSKFVPAHDLGHQNSC